MSLVDLVMPKMGESIMEATILKWHKQPGDTVKQDETVLEIATDKVDSEIPSATEGVMEELLYKENEVAPIGAVIARIRTEGTAGGTQEPASFRQQASNQPLATENSWQAGQDTAHRPSQKAGGVSQAGGNGPESAGGGRAFYSPLVLNIAASEGVPLRELESIPGTGNDGRVTKKDILHYVAEKKSGRSHQDSGGYTQTIQESREARVAGQDSLQRISAIPARTQQADSDFPATVYGGNVEIIEMDRMRRLIADHMVRSKHTSPHVTSFTEADVTNLVHWREKVKKEFEKREHTKITFTPLFIEAIVHCIKKYPLINSSLDGDRILLKKDINIGMATALPNGNLIVPVIRNADQLNLVGLSKQVNTLADNARNNRLRPEDTQGGTFTMTNVGTFGSLMGTPIINQPQVAILAVGAIKKRPVVIESPEGDAIAIRHMMYLSMSYDHRIIDGSLGATFLTAVARELENFKTDREL
jgi:2-oxoglutarate dehydrogenase E2 component (dihydrolipoamide succinyltransferase)